MAKRAAVEFDWLNGDVRELRELYERSFRVDDPGRHARQVLEHEGIPLGLLVQTPRRLLTPRCAILYFHGGGWIVGSPSTHADISRALCERTGLRVVSVDYRLAPEAVAPAPVENGDAVLRHAVAGGLGLETDCAFLCGDSAGGAIALAVERFVDPVLRDRIAGVCSLYGGFGLLDSASLLSRGSRREGIDRECVARMWSLANPADAPSPYSIEALAACSPVPAYLLCASEDPVLDDTLALASAFARHGRQHVLDRVEGAAHGFLHDTGSPQSAAALQRVSAWMARCRSTRLPP